MIETIPTAPAGVLGFRAVGVVEADDYRNVVDPAITATINEGHRVNLVFVMGNDFERYSFGAAWQDALLEGKPSHAWGRIALVTDHTIIGEVVHAISFLFPCDLRFFAVNQQDDALLWAAEGPREIE